MSAISEVNAKKAAHAHTNLNTWGLIQSLCESGCWYGNRSQRSIRAVIRIALREQQRHLREYDKAVGR